MKNIEIDEELYQYIASNTQFIGESASSILRRLLSLETNLASDLEKRQKNLSQSRQEQTLADNQQEELPDAKQDTQSVANKVKNKAETKTKKTSTQRNSVSETVALESKASSATSAAVLKSNESVFNYINKEELAMQRGAVGRFLLILAALYRVHTQKFSLVTDIRGRDRLYFADSESDLTASGSSTKPRQIPDSPYWVITNSNTTRKKMMLTEVAVSLGYGDGDAEKIRELL